MSRLHRSWSSVKTALAMATLLGAGAAQAVPYLSAGLYWDSFSVNLGSNDGTTPSITWDANSQLTYGHVYTATHEFDFKPDWTTPLQVNVDGPSGSHATATVTPSNELFAVAAGLPSTVNLNRYGNFVLSANTTVTFTINTFLEYSDEAAPFATPGQEVYASAEFQVFDGDTLQAHSLSQVTEVNYNSTVGFFGTPGFGTLSLSFSNNSASAAELTLYANANAFIGPPTAVPEADAWALSLAGMAVASSVLATRRRRQA